MSAFPQSEKMLEGSEPKGRALAGRQGGLWQWRKDWSDGEEEMTVEGKVKLNEGVDTNVSLDKSSVIVVVVL